MFKRLAPISENLHCNILILDSIMKQTALNSETHVLDQNTSLTQCKQKHFSDGEDLKVIYD